MKRFFGAPGSKSKSASSNKPYTADPGVASYEHGVHDPSEPSFTTDNLLLSGASHAYSLGPMTYSAPPSPDPSALLSVYPERPVYDRGNSAYVRVGEHDHWPRGEDGWDYVRSPEPHRRADPPPGLSIQTPYSPQPFPSRSSSLGSLPLGASTPPPTAATVTQGTYQYHYPVSEAGQARHGNPLARILRKKPPSITDRVSLSGGGGGAAAVLRTLDPHNTKHHDDRRQPDLEFFDPSMTRASADSYDVIQSSEDDARSSIQLDRERQWRERDREIREAEKKEKGKKPKGQEHHVSKHPPDVDDRGPATIQRSKTKDKKRKDEKKWATFFSKDKDRDDRSDGDETPTEQLTRMIGYLTATGSQDWTLVLEVCDRASANEANAKAAAKALRREFKYAASGAQMSAARLWAIMLKNSTNIFISQSASKKFLDTLEDVITSSRTAPDVRERLLNVLGAAAFASHGPGTSERGKDGFRGLWLKVKPPDRPDEGEPLDPDSDMFATSFHASPTPVFGNTADIHHPHLQSHPTTQSTNQLSPHPAPSLPSRPSQVSVMRSHPSDLGSSPNNLFAQPSVPRHEHVISPEEDIRRLFQECTMGRGAANVLSEALAFAKPEDLHKKDIIKEFYAKCRTSQELIAAQIPWASAGAERSRCILQQQLESAREPIDPLMSQAIASQTTEELLLGDLLTANGELLHVLRMYDDIERIGVEREVERASEVQAVQAVQPAEDTHKRVTSRPERPERVERPERPERPERVERPERPDGQRVVNQRYRDSGVWSPSPPSAEAPRSASRASIQTEEFIQIPPGIGLTSVSEHGSPQHGSVHTTVSSIPLPAVPSPQPLQPHASLQSLTNSSQSHLTNGLVPPARIHHGPRQPATHHHTVSRSPSPAAKASLPARDNSLDKLVAGGTMLKQTEIRRLYMTPPHSPSVEEEARTPVEPSAKALGKRRAVIEEPVLPPGLNSSTDLATSVEEGQFPYESDEVEKSDEESEEGAAAGARKHSTQFVYDAAAERRKEWLKQGQQTTVH